MRHWHCHIHPNSTPFEEEYSALEKKGSSKTKQRKAADADLIADLLKIGRARFSSRQGQWQSSRASARWQLPGGAVHACSERLV